MLPDVRKAFEQAINKKVPVPRGDKTVLMTRVEIGLEQLLNQFAKGDRHARRDLMEIADKLGIDFLAKHKQNLERALTPNYQAILDASLDRRSGNVAPATRVVASSELLDDDAAEPEPPAPSPPKAKIEPPLEPPQIPGQKPFSQMALDRKAGVVPGLARAEGEAAAGEGESGSHGESQQAMTTPLHAAEEYPPGLVLRATLALDFMAFTEFAFGVVRPNTLFKPNWHLEVLAHKLSQVAAGEVRRLIVTMPPRNLKSLFASVALPAWFLGHNPSERVVTVSYSDQLARTHANDFRRLVNDPLYQATFPAMRLARDTEREIVTTMRGKRYTTSIEGTLTGLGGNLVIIDDPLKQEDAHSEAVRRRTIEWYRSTLLSRPDDKQVARILLVMQRVHQDDLAGYLEEQGGFEILNLPAIATQTRTYELGGGRSYVRQQGELLHPSHEPESVLRELKREMGPIAFSAQYQQSPIPPGGTIIKRKWFVFYDAVPTHAPGDQVIMSWDIAFSEQEKGDYSAGVVLLRRREVFFVLEVIRGRLRFDDLRRKILEVKRRYGDATLLIEDSPISKGLIQSLEESSINVTKSVPETDKLARLIAQSDLFSGGSVRLPQRAPWLEDFTAELLAFPGRHDDQVDALTQGLAWGRSTWSQRARFNRRASL